MQISTAPTPTPIAEPTPTFGGSVSASAPQTQSAELTQFLSLLTAQVQNQDPLEPLDATAFTEQLATFSALEQQVQTNRLLEGILAAIAER